VARFRTQTKNTNPVVVEKMVCAEEIRSLTDGRPISRNDKLRTNVAADTRDEECIHQIKRARRVPHGPKQKRAEHPS
jgi:hypothetical protein